jgi:hypothetical protein
MAVQRRTRKCLSEYPERISSCWLSECVSTHRSALPWRCYLFNQNGRRHIPYVIAPWESPISELTRISCLRMIRVTAAQCSRTPAQFTSPGGRSDVHVNPFLIVSSASANLGCKAQDWYKKTRQGDKSCSSNLMLRVVLLCCPSDAWCSRCR